MRLIDLKQKLVNRFSKQRKETCDGDQMSSLALYNTHSRQLSHYFGITLCDIKEAASHPRYVDTALELYNLIFNPTMYSAINLAPFYKPPKREYTDLPESQGKYITCMLINANVLSLNNWSPRVGVTKTSYVRDAISRGEEKIPVVTQRRVIFIGMNKVIRITKEVHSTLVRLNEILPCEKLGELIRIINACNDTNGVVEL